MTMISTSARTAPPAPIDIKSPSVAHPPMPVRSDFDTPQPPKVCNCPTPRPFNERTMMLTTLAQRSDTLESEDSLKIGSPPASFPKTPTSSSWRRDSPAVNVHTHCGRHGDQYLFSGPSLRGLARAMLKRNP
jgi:hypothetical protein